MGQKFFISFNSADRTKAHWIAWTLKEAGHEVAVHDWEIPAGGNAPLWMNTKLAWADRLIAVMSPDYVPARYSPIEWASQVWNDPDGTKGSVIPVIVRPTSNIPPLLRDLSRIDLTNCSEAEAKHRLIKGVDMPAPPERKPAFEKITGEAPDSQHVGPADKPTFVQVSDGLPRWLKLSAAIAVLMLAVFAALTFFVGHGTMVNVQADRGGIAIGGKATGVTIIQGDSGSRPK
jgi:TIR domain